jgi:hypothetical protein
MRQRDALVIRVLTMQYLKGAIDRPFVVVFAFPSCLLIALKQPSSFCLAVSLYLSLAVSCRMKEGVGRRSFHVRLIPY